MSHATCRYITLMGEAGVQVSIHNEPNSFHKDPFIGDIKHFSPTAGETDKFYLKYGYTVGDLVTAMYYPMLWRDVKFKVLVSPDYQFYEDLFRRNREKEEFLNSWRKVRTDLNDNFCLDDTLDSSFGQDNETDEDDVPYSPEESHAVDTPDVESPGIDAEGTDIGRNCTNDEGGRVEDQRTAVEDLDVSSLIEIFMNVMQFTEEELDGPFVPEGPYPPDAPYFPEGSHPHVPCPPADVDITAGRNVLVAGALTTSNLPADERRDYLNKDWGNVFKLYESKRYHEIQQRWGNSTISNPNRNLSALFHKGKNVPYDTPCDEEDDAEGQPAPKRARREPCSFMVGKLIQEITRKMTALRQDCLLKKKEALAVLSRRQIMQMTSTQNPQVIRGLMDLHRWECKNFEDNCNRKLQAFLRPYQSRVDSLKHAKLETERFHKFYQEASGDDESSAYYLNPYEVDDLLSVEDGISGYRTFYVKI